jgi:hypothetical protein
MAWVCKLIYKYYQKVIYLQRTLYDIRMEFWHSSYQRWISNEFLSFPWFFNIVLLLICYIVWIKLVDKRKLKEMLLFGSFIAVAAAFIDIIGVTTGLWEYTTRLFPFSPALFPFDFTIVPILYMLVLQYTGSWQKYLIGSLLASAVNCFVINPLYVLVGILRYHKFNYFYLFILIFIVTTIIKVIYDWISNIQEKKSAV